MTLRIWSSRSAMHIIIWLEIPSSIPDTFCSDAKAAEQQVYSIFQEKKIWQFWARIRTSELHRPAHIQIFQWNESIYGLHLLIPCWQRGYGILIFRWNQIDKNDATYIAWAKDETINLYTYLNYTISKRNWIDTSKLGSSSYSSSKEIYQEILKYLKEYL